MKQNQLLYVLGGLVVGLVLGVLVSLPDKKSGNSMDMEMQSMTHALMGKSGDEFDKVYIQEMVKHHQGAIDMSNLALQNAKRQEIKDLARAIIAAQQQEIQQLSAWAAQWYK
ncbi:MAG TPA: DUF305 domain-containing protein [Patescibacteria group bacterium]|nr:DUF305 domain-containing protein [Patescibacteria group bacterium]